MWLCYLDESGNSGRKLTDRNQRHHWIAAVMVEEKQVNPLANAMRDVACQPFLDDDGFLWGNGVLVPELHGVELFGGTGAWKGFDISVRNEVYRQALSVLEPYGCAVAYASIDKRALADRSYSTHEEPHILALQFLSEKINAWRPDELKLLIADEHKQLERKAIAQHRQMQTSGHHIGGSAPLRSIVDSLHFVNSKDNYGVQLADLVAFILARCRRMPHGSIKPADLFAREMQQIVLNSTRTFRHTWP